MKNNALITLIFFSLLLTIFSCQKNKNNDTSPTTEPETGSETPKSILFVLAHPDDELLMNGTIAHLASNEYSLHFIYATSGDNGGDKTGRGLTGEALATEREQELTEALNVICTPKELLMLRLGDGSLGSTEKRLQLADSIQAVINRISPTAIITFGSDGITGHEDHISVGTVSEHVFNDNSDIPTLLLAGYSPERKRVLDSLTNAHNVDVSIYVTSENTDNLVRVNVAKFKDQRSQEIQSYPTQFDNSFCQFWDLWVRTYDYEDLIIKETRGDFQPETLFEIQ